MLGLNRTLLGISLVVCLNLSPVHTFQLVTHRVASLNVRYAAKKEPEKTTSKKLSESLKQRRIRFTEDVSQRFNVTMPQLPLGFLGGLAAGCVLTVGLAVGPVIDSEKVDDGGLSESVQLFERVITELKNEYVDEVDPRRLFATATDAMLRSLDPYTEFEATKKNTDELRESVSGRYGGVGLVIAGDPTALQRERREAAKAEKEAASSEGENEELGKSGSGSGGGPAAVKKTKQKEAGGGSDSGAGPSSSSSTTKKKSAGYGVASFDKREEEEGRGVMVVNAFEDYAYSYGLRVGDRIVSVEGSSVRGYSADKVRDLLRGSADTSFVTVEIERDSKAPTAIPNPEDLSRLRPVDASVGGKQQGSDQQQQLVSTLGGGGEKGGAELVGQSSLPNRLAGRVGSVRISSGSSQPSDTTTTSAGNERKSSSPSGSRVFEVDLPRSSVKLRDIKLALLLDADSKPIDVAAALKSARQRQQLEQQQQQQLVATDTRAIGEGSIRGQGDRVGGFGANGGASVGAVTGEATARKKPIGFIQLTGFTQDTGREFVNAYSFLERQAQVVAQEQDAADADAAAAAQGKGKGVGTLLALATTTTTTNSLGGGDANAQQGDATEANQGGGGGPSDGGNLVNKGRSGFAAPRQEYLGGLVVDLRGNPGGLLTSAVDLASLLVPHGSDLVSAKGRGFQGVLYRSAGTPVREQTTPLAILVSRGTASAAEIVSGAVQDLDAGLIVGEDRTFGKGLVQNIEALPFDTSLKFTVAKYYTPSGRCIQATEYKDDGSARKTMAQASESAIDGDAANEEEGKGSVDPPNGSDQKAPAKTPPPATTQPGGEAPGVPISSTESSDSGGGSGGDQQQGVDEADEEEQQTRRREKGGDSPQRGGKEGKGRFVARAVDDSERKSFQTANGRTVKDSGGVEVDVKVAAAKVSMVEALLVQEGALFDFASQWTQTNAFKGRPVIGDAEYQSFTKFVMEGVKEGAFKPEDVYAPSLATLERGLTASKQTNALAIAEQLRRELEAELKNDLRTHSSELKASLEEAILSRYLPESELRRIGLERDAQLQAAVAVVADRPRYDALLSPPRPPPPPPPPSSPAAAVATNEGGDSSGPEGQ
mmetsp:Transcript_45775/g.90258  ORF Transcript_45775/g.90258 Transcript_45775/m.90258 type:complete len:1107 (-) Transcript_45775:337-3657(-)